MDRDTLIGLWPQLRPPSGVRRFSLQSCRLVALALRATECAVRHFYRPRTVGEARLPVVGHYDLDEGERDRTGYQRFRVHQASHDAAVAELRASTGEAALARAWDDGAGFTSDEAVSYALRGRGGLNRPPIGWVSLTPAERDVARLVAQGLPNKDIADRLFVSSRTVQTHLTHMYRKLGITSRVQLAQQAARHAESPALRE